MRFSLATRTRFLRGTYEHRIAELFGREVRPGEVFLDAGAHFGYYTLLAAKAGARVHAFEPHAANLKFLAAHVRWNGLGDHVTIHASALGAADGNAEFGVGRGSGSRSLGAGQGAVEVRSIDSLVASGACEPPDWMKIDVQGAEDDVLAGASETLRNKPCSIACAVHGHVAMDECTARLRDLGYTLLRAKEKSVILAFGPGRAVPDVDVASLDM